MLSGNIVNVSYVIAAVLFIVGLKGLAHPRTAVRGNRMAALGMEKRPTTLPELQAAAGAARQDPTFSGALGRSAATRGRPGPHGVGARQ